MAGIYVHVPFCRKKCVYCDFFSVGASQEMLSAYADLVTKEFKAREGELAKEPVRTVYFGGGTPSLLPVDDIGRILGAFPCMTADAEVTIEVNPDDVTRDFAMAVRETGVNRVSMGVQSFDDRELAFLHRRHDAAGAVRAVGHLRSAGFDDISIDLIYGIPGQTMASWEKSIEMAMLLDTPHLSSYCLSYEEGTQLTRMRDRGDFTVCPDELCVAMYERMAEVVAAHGYEQYEISNYSKPGWESRHNSAYWDFTPYLGLGASAHSFDGKVRRYNPASLRRYMEAIEQKGVAFEEEHETDNELYNEWVMTKLRTHRGMDVTELARRFGEARAKFAGEVLGRYAKDGCVECDGSRVRLTRKGGMVSDAVFRDLFIVDED